MNIFLRKTVLVILATFLLSFAPEKTFAQCNAVISSSAIAGCETLTVQFSDTLSTTHLSSVWNFGDGSALSGTNAPTHPFIAGIIGDTTYIVSLTIQCASGTSTDYDTVKVYKRPTVNFSANKTTVCALSDSVCFTNLASSGSGYSYLWNFGDGYSDTRFQPCHSYTTGGTYSVILNVTNSYGCGNSITFPNYIGVIPAPNIDFTVSAFLGCAPMAVNFTNITDTTTSSFTSWQWNFGDGSVINSFNPPTHTFTLPSTYFITLSSTNSLGCSNRTTKGVIVRTKPTSTFTLTSPICMNNSEPITYSGIAGANASYTWSFSGGIASPGTGQGPHNTYWTTPGTVAVKLVVADSGCIDSTSYLVLVNPQPVVTLSVSPNATICQGQSVTFTASPSNLVTYNFYKNGVLIQSSSSSSYLASSLSSGDSFYALGTNASNCTSFNSNVINMAVNPLPVLTLSSNTLSACAGDSITFTASPSGFTSYTFYQGYFPLQVSSNAIYTAANWTNGNSIFALATNNGCTGDSSNVLTPSISQPLPIPQVNCGTSTDSTIEFTWLPVAGATGYVVSVNGGGFFSPSSGNSGTTHLITGLTAGNSATIVVIALGSAPCGDSDPSPIHTCFAMNCSAITFTINPFQSVCNGDSITLNLSGFNIASPSVSWNGLPSGGTTSYTFLPTTSTIVPVIVSNPAQPTCVPVTNFFNVQVNVSPNTTLILNPPVDTICQGIPVSFIAANGGYSNYLFLNGTDTLQTSNNPNYQVPNVSGTFSIHAVTSSAGCQYTTNTIPLTILPAPAVSLSSSVGSGSVCIGDAVTFTASPTGFANYEFFKNNILVQSSSSNTYFLASVNFGDSFYVLATNSTNCTSTSSNVINMQVTPLPIVTLSTSNLSACAGDSIKFTASPSTYTNYSFYQGSLLLQSSSSNIYYSSNWVNGNSISVIATNNGCIGNSSNIITPNISQPLPVPQVNCGTSTNTSIQFTWLPVSGATGYVVNVNGSGGFISPSTGNLGTSHTITGLTSGSSATIKVIALGAAPCGNSDTSAVHTCFASNCSAITFNINPNQTICNGDFITLNLSGFNIANPYVSWNGGASLPNNNSYTFAPTSDIIVPVVVSNPAQPTCVPVTNYFIVQVNPLPTATLSMSPSSNVSCEGTPVTFSASPNGYTNYSFYNGTTLLQSSNSSSFFAPNGAGTFSISVKTTNAGCQSNSNAIPLTILPAPVISLTSSVGSGPICYGDTVTFTASPAGYPTYSFYKNSTLVQSSSSNTYTLSTISSSDSFYVLGTNANNCSSVSSNVINITVKPLPVVVLSSSYSSACAGDSLQFSASPAGYTSYTFYQGFLPLQSSSANLFYSSNWINGNTIHVIASNNGCTGNSSNVITPTISQPLPIPQVNCGTSTTSSIQFTWLPITGATGYSVSVNGGSFTIPSSGNLGTSHTITGLTSGASATIQVFAFGSAPCGNSDTSAIQTCFATNCSAITFTINPNQTVCLGDNLTLTLSGFNIANPMVSWNGGASLSNNNSYTFSPTSNTTVPIIITNPAQSTCVPVTNCFNIQVNPKPAATISSTPSTSTICQGVPATLSVSPAGYSNYSFYDGTTLLQNSSNPTYFVTATVGTYSIHAVTSNLGCQYTTNNIPLTILPSPTVSLSSSVGSGPVCFGSAVTFTASPGGSANYEFYKNAILVQSSPSNSYFLASVNFGDTFYVLATNSINCASTISNVITMQVNPLPQVILSTVNPSSCAGDNIQFTASPAGYTNYSFYQGSLLLQSSSTNIYNSSNWVNGNSIYAIATNNGCTGDSSNVVTPVVSQPLPTPQVNCGVSTTTSIQFSWLPISGSTGYLVSINGGAFIPPSLGNLSTTQSLTGLSSGSSATIRVIALGSLPCGNSDTSVVQTCFALNCTAITFNMNPFQTICSGDAVTLNLSGINIANPTIYWNGSSTPGNASYTFSPTADIVVPVTVSNPAQPTCTPVTNYFIVQVNPLPTATLSMSPSSNVSCEGTPVTFSTSPTGYTNYSFYNGTTLLQSSNSSSFPAPNGAGTYSISVKTTNTGCQYTTNALPLTILPAPTVSLASSVGSGPICYGDTVTFTASPGAYPTYSFYKNAALIQSSSSNTLTLTNINSSDTFYVLGTNSNNCSSLSSNIINITVNPLPVVIISSSSLSACDGDNILFTASPSGYDTYTFYQGFLPLQSSSNNLYSTSNWVNGNSIFAIATNNGCIGNPSNVITPVISQPLPTPQVNCGTSTNTTIQFTWLPITGSTGYLVSVNGGPFVSPILGNTALSELVTGLTAGNGATIRVIALGSVPCGNSDTSEVSTCYAMNCSAITFNINPYKTICSGDSVTFNLSGFNISNPNVAWNGGAALPNNYNYTIFPGADTIVPVVITNPAQPTCVPVTNYFVVRVNPLPIAILSVNPATDTICQGTLATFSASPAGYLDYSFYNGSTLLQSSNNPDYLVPNVPGTVSVQVTTSYLGCQYTTNALPLTILPNPTVVLSSLPGTASICYGDTVKFTANPAGLANYTFYNGAATLQNSSANTLTNSSLGIGSGNNISVVATTLNGCISSISNVINYNVNPIPSISLVCSDADKIICDGDPVLYTASPAGLANYHFFDGTSSIQDSIVNSYVTSGLISGNSITVTGTDLNGCKSLQSNPIVITIKPRPTAYITSNDTTLCKGTSTTLTQNQIPVLTGTTMSWSTGSTNPSITVSPVSTTDYILYSLFNGCSGKPDTMTISVDSSPPPVASAGSDQTVCKGEGINLNASGGISYLWSPTSGLNDSTISNPYCTITATTTYTVIASNLYCRDTATVLITIDLCLTDISGPIPTCITPNDDGANDVFVIPDIDYFKKNSLVIYNRWGNLVFKNAPYTNDWEGKSTSGDQLPDAVYYYILDLGEGEKPHTGYILIQR